MPVLKCGNCGRTLSCGCKKRTASDGKQCCVTCVAGYEKSIKNTTNPMLSQYRNAQKKIN